MLVHGIGEGDALRAASAEEVAGRRRRGPIYVGRAECLDLLTGRTCLPEPDTDLLEHLVEIRLGHAMPHADATDHPREARHDAFQCGGRVLRNTARNAHKRSSQRQPSSILQNTTRISICTSHRLSIPNLTVTCGLNSVELRVHTVPGEELVVRAELGDARALEHDDEIRHANGGKAMGDENR